MEYEVINEELGIKACRLADLTAEQVNHFLGQWEEGATIGTLTPFYDDKNGDVVLNKDNAQYEFYAELAEGYLSASEDNRKEFREKVPKSVKETVDVLENCLRVRRVNREIFKVERAPISCDMPMEVLKELLNRNSRYPLFAVFNAFTYGVMQGKRMERARRKVVQ